MPREHHEGVEDRDRDQGGRQAGSGRGKHGEEEPHQAHNEHTEDHQGERRQSDSRR